MNQAIVEERHIWTPEEIRTHLENDNLWLFRGVVAIYKYQTEVEQKIEKTNENNNVGFNKPDSKFLSSIAKWIIGNRLLSFNQVYKTRKRMLKYAGQLARIANKEQ